MLHVGHMLRRNMHLKISMPSQGYWTLQIVNNFSSKALVLKVVEEQSDLPCYGLVSIVVLGRRISLNQGDYN